MTARLKSGSRFNVCEAAPSRNVEQGVIKVIDTFGNDTTKVVEVKA
jgi:hypothetical protein